MTQLFISTIPAVRVVESQHPFELEDSLNLVQPGITFNYVEREQTAECIALDEGDTFQCGKCLGKFSFPEVISHKRNKCSGKTDSNLTEGSVIQIVSLVSTTECPEKITEQEAAACQKIQPRGEPKACNYCGKEFKKNYDLEQHLRCHTGERPFMCVVCGRAFKQKNNVDKHMDTHKAWPIEIDNLPPVEMLTGNQGMTLFSCQFCLDTFTTYRDWKSHLKTHAELKVYKCSQENCSQTFKDQELFITHCQSHQGLAKFCCHACSDEFPTLDDLSQHQITHLNQSFRKEKCSKCECVYPSNQNHTCRKYPCPMCDRTFVAPRFLRRHLLVHSTETSHPCSDCGKSFKSLKLLASHRLTHATAKPHVCPVCSTTFKRREKLTRHKKIHDKTSILNCAYFESQGCTKVFNRKDKLKNHLVKNHTDGKTRPTV